MAGEGHIGEVPRAHAWPDKAGVQLWLQDAVREAGAADVQEDGGRGMIKIPCDLVEDQHLFCEILKEASKLRWKKLQDYGQSYRNFGILGVIIRLGDKMSRIERLFKDPKSQKIKNESIRDTLLDILNYSAMAIMLLDEE